MGLYKALFSCLLVFSLSLNNVDSAESCVPYPTFLQNAADNPGDSWYWDRNIMNTPNAFRFLDTNLSYSSALPEKWEVLKTCPQLVNKALNLFEIVDFGEPNNTVCVGFNQIAPNIVRVTYALKESEDKSCNEEPLTSLPWLLVSSWDRTNGGKIYNQSPLVGGYLFTSQTPFNASLKQTCEHPLPGRLEIGCLPEDGMTFMFPDVRCIPVQGWAKEQGLLILSTWKEDEHDYLLVGSDYYRPEWCMRLTTDDITVWGGATCPTGEIEGTPNYSVFNLTKLEPPSDCWDDWAGCEASVCTDPLFASYCRKTCTLCSEDKSCKFDGKIVSSGRWFNSGEARMSALEYGGYVDITESQIDFKDLTTYNCTSQIDASTYVLKPNVLPGCRPRFHCGRFTKLTDPVLRYKISQPSLKFSNYPQVCEESKFQNDPPPIGPRYRSALFRNLISTDHQKLQNTITCPLRGNFTVEEAKQMVPGKEAVICAGSLDTLTAECGTGQTLELDLNCTAGDSRIPEVFNCIGDVPSGAAGTNLILVVSYNGDEKNASCLVVQTGAGGETVSILPTGQCNEGTPMKLAAKEIQVALDISKLARDDDCDTTTTERTPTTSESTSAPESTSESTSAPESTSESTSAPESTSESSVMTTMPSQSTPVHTTPSPKDLDGAVIGIIMGALLAYILLIVLIILACKKCKRNDGVKYRREPENQCCDDSTVRCLEGCNDLLRSFSQ